MRNLRLLLFFLIAPCAAVYADTLQYTFVPLYPTSPTHTFSFQLPSNPLAGQLTVNTSQGYLGVKDVAVVADGVPGTFLAVFNLNRTNGTTTTGGDLILSGIFTDPLQRTFTYINTAPLYSGDPFSPTFLTGSFVLREYGAPYGGASGLLTVTNLSTAVTPEPSSMVLLTLGLLSSGVFFKKRTALTDLRLDPLRERLLHTVEATATQ